MPGRDECTLCEDGKVLLAEIAALSAKISLTLHDIEADAALAETLDVDHVPAIVVRGVANRPLRFIGIPSSAEFPVFIDALIAAGANEIQLSDETQRKLKRVRSDVRVQVFMSPTCLHSPAVSRTALRFALASSRIQVQIIEIAEFPALAQRLGIKFVPTVIFDGKQTLPGAMDEARFADSLLRYVEGKPLGLTDWQRGPVTALPIQTRPRKRNRPCGRAASCCRDEPANGDRDLVAGVTTTRSVAFDPGAAFARLAELDFTARMPFAVMGSLFVILRAPFLPYGYGTDPDAWRVALTGEYLIHHGKYFPSRLPGNPLHELLITPLVPLGWVATGLATVLVSLLCVYLFAQVVKRASLPTVASSSSASPSRPCFSSTACRRWTTCGR